MMETSTLWESTITLHEYVFPEAACKLYALIVDWKEGKGWFCCQYREKENEKKILQYLF